MEYKDVKDSPSTKISKSIRDNHVWNLVCRSGFISHKDTPASTCKWIRKYVYEYVYARQLFRLTIHTNIDIINMIKCINCGEREVKELYRDVSIEHLTELQCYECIRSLDNALVCDNEECHEFGMKSKMLEVKHIIYCQDCIEKGRDITEECAPDIDYYYYCCKSCYIPSVCDNCPYCKQEVLNWLEGPEDKRMGRLECECGIFCTHCNTKVNIWQDGPKREDGKEFFECECGVICRWCSSCTPFDELNNLSCKCSLTCKDCKIIIKYDKYDDVEFCNCRNICPYCGTDVYNWDEGPELEGIKQYIACDCSVKCRYCGDRNLWKHEFNVLYCDCYPVCTDCGTKFKYDLRTHKYFHSCGNAPDENVSDEDVSNEDV